MPESIPPAAGAYKPNIYPIIYWALVFGVIAGAILFVVYLLSRYITVIWFPVFLAGLMWGGFRNYKKQKAEWMRFKGTASPARSFMEEIKEAARDIFNASREMMAEQNQPEDSQTQADQGAISTMPQEANSDNQIDRPAADERQNEDDQKPEEQPPTDRPPPASSPGG